MATYGDFTVFKDTDATLTVTMSPVTVITGWTLSLVVRKQYGSTAASLTKAGVITDATNGIFTFAIADTDTELLDVGEYVYNVLRTDAGAETVLAYGNLTLMPTSK